MQNDKRTQLLGALQSEEYQKRLQKVRRFEEISGGGVRKQIERLFTVPSIYIPYVWFAKARASRVLRAKARLFWGRTIWIDLDDYDALILSMYGGLYGGELKLTKFLIRNLGTDDVFYDVGANRGFYTFLATELCKEVHAFEPVKRLAKSISKSVRNNEHAVVNAVALSDTDGAIDFYMTGSTMTNTISRAVAERHSSTTITVPTMTLDEYVKTHAAPTVLKIDAEGAEEQIIKGGSVFLSTHAPIIAMEIWGKGNKWELSMAAADRLRSMGYQSFRLDNEGGMEKTDGDLSSHVAPQEGDNFVFRK